VLTDNQEVLKRAVSKRHLM